MGSLRQCLPHTTLSCLFGKREMLNASHSKKGCFGAGRVVKLAFHLEITRVTMLLVMMMMMISKTNSAVREKND